MPFVTVHMWTGRSAQQKRKLTRAITDAMVEHAGAKPDHLHVAIQEYELENWARAGVLATDLVTSTPADGANVAAADADADPAAVEPRTGALHHMLLECADLDASVRFYTEVVGVRLRKHDTHRDGRRLVLTHNSIGLTSAAGGGRNVEHLAFSVASVDQALAIARAHGATVVRGPGPGPYGHTLYLADPDGNEVELIEDAAGAAAAPDADAQTAREIAELEHAVMTAMQRRDGEFLERVLGTDYTMTAGVPGREVRTRADWIEIALNQYVLTAFDFEEMTVQVYPGCAVARSRFTQQAFMNDSRRNSSYRITDVWIQRAGAWQMQARHSQRVAGD